MQQLSSHSSELQRKSIGQFILLMHKIFLSFFFLANFQAKIFIQNAARKQLELFRMRRHHMQFQKRRRVWHFMWEKGKRGARRVHTTVIIV